MYRHPPVCPCVSNATPHRPILVLLSERLYIDKQIAESLLIFPDSPVSLFASPEPRAFLPLKLKISVTSSPFLQHLMLLPEPLQKGDFSWRGCLSAKLEELQKKILLGFSLKTVGRNSGFIPFNLTHIIPSHTTLQGVFSAEGPHSPSFCVSLFIQPTSDELSTDSDEHKLFIKYL